MYVDVRRICATRAIGVAIASGVHEGDRMPVIGGSGFRLASVRQSSQVRHDLKTAREMRERPPPPPRNAWAIRDLVAGGLLRRDSDSILPTRAALHP
jgi:hypothetical protein